MLETSAQAKSDLRPEIVVCVCDLEVAETLGEAPALREGLQTARADRVDEADPEALAGLLERRVRDPACRAVLIVGRSRDGETFRIQTRAENRALGGRGRHLPTGPGIVRATAPATEIARALSDAGQSAEVSSDAEDDAASYVLFRALCGLPDGVDAPSVGLLRVPTGDADLAGAGVEAAMRAIARHMSPPAVRSPAS